MSTTTWPDVDGLEELTASDLQAMGSGFPLAPVIWGVGIYLAKTCGDHWGEFKGGVADGFRHVWGPRG